MQSNYQDHIALIKKLIYNRLTANDKLFLLRQRLKFENKINQSGIAVQVIRRRVKDWWDGK